MREEFKNNDFEQKINKKTFIILVSIVGIVILLLSIGFGIIKYFDYQYKIEKDKMLEQQRIEKDKMLKQQKNEDDYKRNQLIACQENARLSSANLWQSNCPENNKNCTLNQATIQWIDQRYETELQVCRDRWK